MHAAVELADQIDAAALVVPTATGGTRSRVLEVPPPAADRRARARAARGNQLALEWGVYPTEHGRRRVGRRDDRGGAGRRARVRRPAERRRRRHHRRAADRARPGATNLIMVREIP